MSAPVDVLGALQQIADGEGDIEVTALRVRTAVAELIDFARASRCECLGPTPLSTGETIPAITCDRCKALTHAGVMP